MLQYTTYVKTSAFRKQSTWNQLLKSKKPTGDVIAEVIFSFEAVIHGYSEFYFHLRSITKGILSIFVSHSQTCIATININHL